MFGRITYGAGPIYTRNSTYPSQGLEPKRIREILGDDPAHPYEIEFAEQVHGFNVSVVIAQC